MTIKLFSFVAFSLLFTTQVLLGQNDTSNINSIDTSGTRTLFSKANVKSIGFYVSPEISFAKYASESTPIGGLSAMLLINNNLGIGIIHSMTVDRNFAPSSLSITNDLNLRVQNFGGRIEYIWSPKNVFHISFPLTFTYGRASMDSLSTAIDYPHGQHGHYNNNNNSAKYASLTPGLNVELNLIKWVKLFTGINYRIPIYYKNQSVYNLTKSDMQGINYTIGAKIGLYDYKLR